MLSRISNIEFSRRHFHTLVIIGITIQVINIVWLTTSDSHWIVMAFAGASLGMVLASAGRPALRWLKLRVTRRLRQRRSIEPTTEISPRMTLSTWVVTCTTEIYMVDETPRDEYHPLADAPATLQDHRKELGIEEDIHHVCWERCESHDIKCANPDCSGRLDMDMDNDGRSLFTSRSRCPECIEKNYVVTVTRLTVRD